MKTVFDGDNLILIPESPKEVESLKKFPALLQLILSKVSK